MANELTHDNAGRYTRPHTMRDTYARMRSRVFTVYVQFPADEVEEIDVLAFDASDANAIARDALQRDYEPGGKIMTAHTTERYGWYL